MWKSQVSLGQEERDMWPRVDGVQTHRTQPRNFSTRLSKTGLPERSLDVYSYYLGRL